MEFDAVYGGLLFVAIILGGLFVLALVLIIYYKQVSEGYEDRDRFLILMQVGMSREEVRSTIRTQMFTFYLPLLVSGLHLLAAFPLTRAVLELLSLTNVPLFALVAGICYLAFALFYVLVYLKTTGSYYRIIRQAGEQQAQGLFSP